ncbi:MAG: hypothetical protein AAGA09_01355 [Pseudomonadota bacterium]
MSAREPDDALSLAPEFSVVTELSSAIHDGWRKSVAANETERAAIARRFGVPAVEQLEGDIAVFATARDFRVEGAVRATLTRECVASLEPLQETVEEAFILDFARVSEADLAAERAEAEKMEEGAPSDEELAAWLDRPEPHAGDSLDVGELLVQQVSLAMDPFPRKAGVESLAETFGAQAETSPFDVLKSLSSGDDGSE